MEAETLAPVAHMHPHDAKRALGQLISDAPPPVVQSIVHLVRAREPTKLRERAGGWDIRLDCLSDSTLQSLTEFTALVTPQLSLSPSPAKTPFFADSTSDVSEHFPPQDPVTGSPSETEAAEVALAESLIMMGRSMTPAPPTLPAPPTTLPSPKPRGKQLAAGVRLSSASWVPPVLSKRDSFVNNPELKRCYDVIQLLEARHSSGGDKAAALTLLPTAASPPTSVKHSESFGDYVPLGPDAAGLEDLAEALPGARGSLVDLWVCNACLGENEVRALCVLGGVGEEGGCPCMRFLYVVCVVAGWLPDACPLMFAGLPDVPAMRHAQADRARSAPSPSARQAACRRDNALPAC